MRFSLGGKLDITSENDGKVEMDYSVANLGEGESFLIFVDNEEVERFTFEDAEKKSNTTGLSGRENKKFTHYLPKGEHLIQLSV